MSMTDTIIAVKGAGEMASGVAVSLFQAGFRRILMLDKTPPLAVRRTVSFCQALADDWQSVEGVRAVRVVTSEDLAAAWDRDVIGVCDDPQWLWLQKLRPQVVVDAIIAKKNLGTSTADAALVIALGPGFVAGKDAHAVIETQRGHDLGRILYTGSARPDTGEPAPVMGHSRDRVLRAPCAGTVEALKDIGESVRAGDIVLRVDGRNVAAAIGGVLRGAITSGAVVPQGCKIGDIDPRDRREYCFTVSDKARALGGAVLTAVLGWLHARCEG